MYSSDCDIVFLTDLQKKLRVDAKNILSRLISDKIDIFAVINSKTTKYNYDELLEFDFACVYQMSRPDLLSLRSNNKGVISVSFRCEKKPEYENKLGNERVYDLQFDYDFWNFIDCKGLITMNDLFVCNDKELDLTINTGSTNNTIHNQEELPRELQLAIAVYYEFWHEKPEETNSAKLITIQSFLANLQEGISDESVKRIGTIAKPENARKGGSPKSEWREYKGKSEEK